MKQTTKITPIPFFLLSILFFSQYAIAGNSIQPQCGGGRQLISNVKIQSINVTQNWMDRGKAVNIKVNNNWYGLFLNKDKFDETQTVEGASYGLLQVALSAYYAKIDINF